MLGHHKPSHVSYIFHTHAMPQRLYVAFCNILGMHSNEMGTRYYIDHHKYQVKYSSKQYHIRIAKRS
ncbi:hypothetical protein EUGRSUZ_H02542 [Eucalyptus grandis]|uniref:Uncharacterized protein n=2 Tax=Eucalyptus grandis TaxID=71139 RepID=A0ACC3JS18_EUCGR|nr:hypothetical protein EUGRSUZ_H02542 [Eucalyptus grandis]